MFILKKGHQPGVYVPLRSLFLVYQMVFCLKFRFVSFLLNFSHVGTEPWLPR